MIFTPGLVLWAPMQGDGLTIALLVLLCLGVVGAGGFLPILGLGRLVFVVLAFVFVLLLLVVIVFLVLTKTCLERNVERVQLLLCKPLFLTLQFFHFLFHSKHQ